MTLDCPPPRPRLTLGCCAPACRARPTLTYQLACVDAAYEPGTDANVAQRHRAYRKHLVDEYRQQVPAVRGLLARLRRWLAR